MHHFRHVQEFRQISCLQGQDTQQRGADGDQLVSGKQRILVFVIAQIPFYSRYDQIN